MSYLWGQAPSQQDQSCEATATRFYQPYSIFKGSLPATIGDTITVTLALEEAYLWVDRLCIRQNDMVDKAKFIPRMHEIYASAQLESMPPLDFLEPDLPQEEPSKKLSH